MAFGRSIRLAASASLAGLTLGWSDVPPFGKLDAFLLGKPEAGKALTNRIPAGESAVFSMAAHPEGGAVCGTRVIRGRRAWVFYFDAGKKGVSVDDILPLGGALSGQRCVSSLLQAGGAVYGATSNFLSLNYASYLEVENEKYPGGHLFRLKGRPGKFSLEDLGAPFPGEGIAALAADQKGEAIYGITVPSQIFFSYTPKTRRVKELGRLPSLELERNRYIGKSTQALVSDDRGSLYGSARGGKIFRFSPGEKTLTLLDVTLPTERTGGSYDCVTAWVKTGGGRIFGGTWLDGKLFEFLPREGKIRDLGITSRTGNVTGLHEVDGVIYGLSGSPGASSKIFAYHTGNGFFAGFHPSKTYFANAAEKVKWIPLHLKNLVPLGAGAFLTGEDDSNGHVFVFTPSRLDGSE